MNHLRHSALVRSCDCLYVLRQKSGIWGFRSDRNDEVNGWQAKVFSATGVEIVTRTRTEHLPEGDKKKQKRKLLY